MGYLHINNLYSDQDILMFKECYAMEKINGTSSHLKFKRSNSELTYFSGGVSHEHFKQLFNHDKLMQKFIETGVEEITVYGEAYGGKCQKMSKTYGDKLKFIGFDVQINDLWLTVPDMDAFIKGLDLEVVYWKKITTDLKEIDAERDAPSMQAIRNGILEPRIREGVILRPLIELRKNNDKRIIAKHKRPEFNERATEQKVDDPAKLIILEDAKAITNEWATYHRLEHVLDKMEKDIGIEKMGMIIKAMIEDIKREANKEIVMTKDAEKMIGKKTVELFKQFLQNKMN